MEKAHFDQTGGFPLETNTLNFLQKSHFLLSKAISGIAGNLVILEGCKKNGNLVESGIIAIDGEVLTFKGGTLGNYVIIKETKEARTFENGESKDVYFTRTAKFGTGSPMFKWSDFRHLTDIKELSDRTSNNTNKIVSHTHDWGKITDKPNVFPPDKHNHIYFVRALPSGNDTSFTPHYNEFFGKDCRLFIDSMDKDDVTIFAPPVNKASDGCVLHVCVSPNSRSVYLEKNKNDDLPFLYKNIETTKIRIDRGKMLVAVRDPSRWIFYD